MLMDVLLYGVGTFVLNIFCVYCWYSLIDKPFKLKDIKICLTILVMAIVGVILNLFCPQPFRMILSFIFLIIVNYVVAIRDLKYSIISVLISQVIVMVSELSFVIITSFFFSGDLQSFSFTPIGNLLLNIYTSGVSLIILKTKLPNKLFRILDISTNIMRKREVLTYLIMILAIIIISTAESYMNLSLTIVLTTNTIMTLIFIFIVLKFAIAEDKYSKTNNKYQVSITSLKEYEEILDKLRVSTHENKNQLLTIKTMVKDQKVISYIDTIIDEKIKDNDEIMNKAYKIPDARFRSLIYPKVCKIDELKIKYKFSISNDVKTAELIDLDDYLVGDACKALGVYLDNAIEAVKDLKKKLIIIEIYIMDGYLCFDITNNFEGVLDIDKIFKPKYTTKAGGHGYGLEVVNKVVRDNENIENECEVNGDKITQRLKIKM